MRLVFAIPTWNRADELYKCVISIAEQNPDAIYIADNCTSDHTAEVCRILMERYPCITYVRYEDFVAGDENLRRVIGIAEGDYIWTFGDDDILLPGALQLAKKLLELELDFYHVAEESRSTSKGAIQDTLFNLCCEYGFIDMTGFITGNITRAEKLKLACKTSHWEVYKHSVFPQSLMLLETLAQSESLLVDFPMIQSAVETEETRIRWEKAGINSRFIFIAEGLILLRDAGIITNRLPEKFFRYLNGSLLQRMMNEYIARTFNPEKPVTDQEWKCFEIIANFTEKPRGEILVDWYKRVRESCDKGLPAIIDAFHVANGIKAEANTIQLPEYPFTFLP